MHKRFDLAMRTTVTPRLPKGSTLYTTGLFCMHDRVHRSAPFNGRGWTIGLRKRSVTGEDTSVIERFEEEVGIPAPNPSLSKNRNGTVTLSTAPEIVIYARSRESAQRAADLLFCGILLFSGGMRMLDGVRAYADDDDTPEARNNRFTLSAPNLRTAAALAATLSQRLSWQYAAVKYWLSHRLCSPEPMDFHPGSGLHLGVTKDPFGHALFAHAITSAYGALEELGLEARASAKNPSVLPDGSLNPVVIRELETRLRQARIDLNEEETWLIRGPRTRIEARRPIKGTSKPSWAGGQLRDRHLPVAEAILRASWLRSGVSAHTIKGLTRSLSETEVHNVQMLVRRLLLERVGYWRSF
jgi:hypothetical protein